MVAHESSNLSETVSNMVSYIQNTTTPKTPLYETQAEGKTHLLRQSPSACKLPYSSKVRAPQKMISFVGDDGSIPSLGVPAAFIPFSLPDTGAGIFQKLNHTTFARADSNYLSAGYVRLNEPPLQHSYISGLADHCLPPLKKQRVHAGQLTTLHYNYN